MKSVQFILLCLITVIMFFSFTCENPTEPYDDFIEPEMVSINENLIFTYGPSWDTTFVPPDSLPMLVVELEPYEIGKYEVTNKEYEKFVRYRGYGDSTYWSEDGWNCKVNGNWTLPVYWSEDKLWLDDPYSNKKNTPVHGISYFEAEAYCKWLSIKTNKNYHIPSSYQWERAAKGPDPGTKYPWGNEHNEKNANYAAIMNSTFGSVTDYSSGKSHDGCYQMIGNVYEICFRVPDEWGDFALICPYPSLACSEPKCMKETMSTTSGGSIEKDTRRYGVGLRICLD